MRYKNIRLKNRSKFNLQKYNEHQEMLVSYLEEGIEKLKRIDSTLADAVIKCPSIYSELSDHQAYFITRGLFDYVGSIYIGTSTDEKDLEVKLYLDEDRFIEESQMIKLIGEIVDSLCFYCWDKKNIEIKLVNDIDLQSIDNSFEKQVYSPNNIGYKKANKYNTYMPTIMNEMMTLKNIGYERKFMSIDIPNEDELIYEYMDDTIPFEESFYGVKYVIWDKQTGFVELDREGNISGFNAIEEFRVSYNYCINNNSLDIKFEKDNKNLKLSCQRDVTFSNELGSVTRYYDTDKRFVKYKSKRENNLTTTAELRIDSDGDVEYANIDFNIHNGQKRIGYYHIGIRVEKITLQYRNRRSNINDSLELGDLFGGQLRNLKIQDIDYIVNMLIPIIMEHANRQNKTIIINPFSIESLVNIEVEMLDYIETIKDKVVLESLRQKIETFTYNYAKGKTKVKDNN